MKLATYRSVDDAAVHTGVVIDDRVHSLRSDDGPRRDMTDLLALDRDELRRLADRAAQAPGLALSDVRLAAPVPRPPEFIGIGLNYRDHANEAGLAIPIVPLVFNKQSSCVAGPHDDVLLPALSDQLDYEGELGLVIGRAHRGMTASEAAAAILGYVVVNDVSLRDVQMASPTHTMGKSFDTHGPFGPFIVTVDEVADPQSLVIETCVNGEVRQRGGTADMIFGCAEIVAHLSRVMTLAPGTIVTTGTPAGVCFGAEDPSYLRDGDVVTVRIDGIGQLRNRIVAERRAS